MIDKGDYLYKVTYDNDDIHVEPTKIVDVKTHKYILRYWTDTIMNPMSSVMLPNYGVYREYTCDNGEMYTQNNIDNLHTYEHRGFWICSKRTIAEKYVKKKEEQ